MNVLRPEIVKLYCVGDVLTEQRFNDLLEVMDKIARQRAVAKLRVLQAEYSNMGIQIGVATLSNAISVIEREDIE